MAEVIVSYVKQREPDSFTDSGSYKLDLKDELLAASISSTTAAELLGSG